MAGVTTTSSSARALGARTMPLAGRPSRNMDQSTSRDAHVCRRRRPPGECRRKPADRTVQGGRTRPVAYGRRPGVGSPSTRSSRCRREVSARTASRNLHHATVSRARANLDDLRPRISPTSPRFAVATTRNQAISGQKPPAKVIGSHLADSDPTCRSNCPLRGTASRMPRHRFLGRPRKRLSTQPCRSHLNEPTPSAALGNRPSAEQ